MPDLFTDDACFFLIKAFIGHMNRVTVSIAFFPPQRFVAISFLFTPFLSVISCIAMVSDSFILFYCCSAASALPTISNAFSRDNPSLFFRSRPLRDVYIVSLEFHVFIPATNLSRSIIFIGNLPVKFTV